MLKHVSIRLLVSLPLCLTLSVLTSSAQAEMKSLDDDILSSVSGQSGITMDMQTRVELGEISYFDDGRGMALQGVRLISPEARTAADWDRFVRHEADLAGIDQSLVNPANLPMDMDANTRVRIDILDQGILALDIFSINRRRFEIDDIRFIDTPGQVTLPDAPSMGGVFFDFQLDGNLDITGAGTDGSSIFGGRFDIDFLFEKVRLGYRTNGNELFLDDATITLQSPGTILTYDTVNDELDLRLPDFVMSIDVGAIRYSDNPLNHGVSNDVSTGNPLPSYGSLWAFMDLNTNVQITAGGASGTQGITFNAQTVIEWLDLVWGDDIVDDGTAGWVGMLGVTGNVDLQNLRIDILADPDAGIEPAKDFGNGLAFSFERLQANLGIEDFVIAETGANVRQSSASRNLSSLSLRSIGSLEANLLFTDGSYDGLTPLTNRIYLQAGGNVDAGPQGIRLDTQLSLISPLNETNFVYTENGNSLMLSRFEAFADGDLTIDITRAGNINGTDFFNGLRLGFEDFAFGYRVEGFRVGKSTGDSDDLKDDGLQAATSLPGISGSLFGLGGHPALEGTLNGHITIGPGGAQGNEGLTVNSDLSLTDGNMAVYIDGDGTGRGIWLSGLNYDIHLRDMLIDVTGAGLEVYETERWSTMDVTDLRIGDKTSGSSFGRIVQEVYELGSQRVISDGGAGTVCVGASGSTMAQCQTNGGFWSDRGDQGVTIAHTRHLVAEDTLNNRRNRFTWEVDRIGEGTAPVNGSGMQLVFDNFTTNDGDGLSDTYGLRTVTHFDLAQTMVINKETGPDSNGVVGNRGDVKIMNPDGSYYYTEAAGLTAAELANLPVGIALRNTTSFRELDIDRVNLVHPTGGESTLLYGLKLQNFEVRTDITATPMD
jgi:hypothetical protein